MALNTHPTLEASAHRLFPNQSLEYIFAELLLERAKKNLIKYQTMSRQFEERYGEVFAVFRAGILNSVPDFATEQDYFDWELAVTGIKDMEDEIRRLHDLNISS